MGRLHVGRKHDLVLQLTHAIAADARLWFIQQSSTFFDLMYTADRVVVEVVMDVQGAMEQIAYVTDGVADYWVINVTLFARSVMR